ncbi:MAG: electron transfer flavoprotein subunit alpha [Tissierellales bacterium]|nr:electron transfer flavoprotein subunit alpha [Tissierellales bacterium]MBN2827008.1 electron transfer flavoprotein subunit alpha [Tissierellales bacterium]
MAELIIDTKKCIGCGLCIKSCAYNALSLANKKAVVDDDCVFCGSCIKSCPVEAIWIEREIVEIKDLTNYKDIWVLIEEDRDEILPVSYELLTKGRELAAEKKCDVNALILGNNIQKKFENIFEFGANKIYYFEGSEFNEKLDEVFIEYLDYVCKVYNPEIFLFGATGFGRSIAPKLAARLNTGLTADCTILSIDDNGLLKQTRPAFGGNLMATIICPNHRPQMATVRSGVMKAYKVIDKNRRKELINIEAIKLQNKKTELIERIIEEKTKSISDAEIIVSVGKGIGSQKNIEIVQKFADLLGAEIGVSRPLVDIGWAGYEKQIGQTGSVIAPKLLIALGISGAIQHLAGISGAQTIIAINTDPEASIFSVADYKVVGDCIEILKGVINKLTV